MVFRMEALSEGALPIKRLTRILAGLAVVVMASNGFCWTAFAMPDVSATCACVVERQSGCLIAGINEHQRASMASTTKIMTALLLCESVDLDSTATVTEPMTQVEGSSMGLMPGDTVHYRDLLYGMMLASGNDAATATAILLAGSLPAFAKRMNARAAQIGMKDTHFVTPSGLDHEEHYSTAYDMAILAVEALKNEKFAKAVSCQSACLEYGNPPYRRTLKNHNRLLSLCSICDGVKTGFTKKSGRCLVSSAWDGEAGVVVVTLRDPNDWDDHQKLIQYGLSCLETRALPLPTLPDVTVLCGKGRLSVTVDPVSAALPADQFDKIVADVELGNTAFAPVQAGEPLGRVVYRLNGAVIAEAPIVASSAADADKRIQKTPYKAWIRAILGSK